MYIDQRSFLVTFADALYIVEIIVSIVLVIIILLQAKGSGFSGVFGGETSQIYRTRRGLERRLFQFTIAMSAVFILLSLVTSIFGSGK
jgi:preprotein translocase subunit SecG